MRRGINEAWGCPGAVAVAVAFAVAGVGRDRPCCAAQGVTEIRESDLQWERERQPGAQGAPIALPQHCSVGLQLNYNRDPDRSAAPSLVPSWECMSLHCVSTSIDRQSATRS